MAYGKGNYLHYYFANYALFQSRNASFLFSQITQEARKMFLNIQLENFIAHKESLQEQWTDKVDGVEELFTSDFWNDIMVEQDQYSYKGIEQYNAVNVFNPSKYDSAQLNAFADEITNNLQAFCSGITNLANSIQKSVESKGFKQDYAQAIMYNFASTGRMPDTEEGAAIVSALLQKEGFKKMADADSDNPLEQIEGVIQNLLTLANNLPSYISEKGYNKDYKQYSKNSKVKAIQKESEIVQLYNAIISKVAGARSYAQGIIGELGGEEGVALGSAKFCKEFQKLGYSLETANTGEGMSVRAGNWLNIEQNIKLSPELMQNLSSGDYVKNKKDVSLRVVKNEADGTGKVILDFGFNIKNYSSKPKTDAGVMTYTIQSSSVFGNFYQQLFNEDKDFMYLKSIGAGHGNGNNRLRGGARVRSGLPTYTNAMLDTYWTQLIRSVVTANLAYTLAGNIQENTLFLVLNGKVFGIDQVLKGLINYIDNENRLKAGQTDDFGYGYLLQGLSRKRLMGQNTWQGQSSASQADAESRSVAANSGIDNLINSAKIQVSLRVLGKMLNSK